jgi:O-methyltransferase domain/Dimerisation domain
MPSDQTTNTEAAAEMERLLKGAWVAQIVQAAAELGLADHFGGKAQDATSLASATGTHAPSLARLLRALAAIGIVHEGHGRQYTLTPLGATLRTDQPGSMRAWARLKLCDAVQRPWHELTHAVRTGDNAFNHLFGTDVWTYRSTHPDFSSLFNAAMQSLTQGTDAAIGMEYKFGEFGWIVDIGGGNGSLLLPILERHPAMRGTIVELPHVAAQTRERISAAGLADRCDAVDGDALTTEVPAGADAYVLKLVIHGKTDDNAVAILRNCRAAMPAHGRLLIIERLLPEQIDPNDARTRTGFVDDLNMMLTPGGKERTEAEFRHLIAEAGLRFVRVVPTSGTSAIVEAELA